jgi:lipopolysaccharide export system permease protein
MLQQFIPLLAMTFFICLFIVMMQFLWSYIQDLVGKGLSIDVLAELFFYAALTMVPTALPLAVLLASLMTFGNLGEKLELTAMKAAGISLFRIMKPLIVLMAAIAVGAFFFQNNVLPIAQTKMWTLLFSMRQKSPEMEIPVKSFYDQIPGMNLYIEDKNQETGMLKDLIIYDTSRGIDNVNIILADSGKINFTEDKTHIFVHLYTGEVYGNDRSTNFVAAQRENMPFSRESFSDKQLYYVFDANFNRIDESGMRSQYIGKNIAELSASIDSIQQKVDSIGNVYGTEIKENPYFGVPYYENVLQKGELVKVARHDVKPKKELNVDSIFSSPTPSYAKTYISQALSKAERQKQMFEFKSIALMDQEKSMRRHDIELEKKFTLSLACIIFFFIGAPLGAIIKKGGIGTPLVISVFLFIIYFIIDNSGYKAARDGKMEVWAGIWMSSAVMLPLGIYVTYKAVGDFELSDLTRYTGAITRFFSRVRHPFNAKNVKSETTQYSIKEFIINEVEPQYIVPEISRFMDEFTRIVKTREKMSRIKQMFRVNSCAPIKEKYASIVEHLTNSRELTVIGLISRLPNILSVSEYDTVSEIFGEIKTFLDPDSEFEPKVEESDGAPDASTDSELSESDDPAQLDNDEQENHTQQDTQQIDPNNNGTQD